MGDISPPTMADYAFSASNDNRQEITALRQTIQHLVDLLVSHNVITPVEAKRISPTQR